MGFGGISIWQLLIVLAIVLLLFGTKRLRNIGSDLGNAVKGFKGAMSDGGKKKKATQEKLSQPEDSQSEHAIDGEARSNKSEKS